MGIIKCLIWKANDSVVKLMVSITSSVSLWYRLCYKKLLNYDNDNKCPKTYYNIKEDFLWLQSRYWLSFRALTLLEKLRICPQISNELHNVALRYRFFSLGSTDPFYRKTLISSAKNSVQIACAQII